MNSSTLRLFPCSCALALAFAVLARAQDPAATGAVPGSQANLKPARDLVRSGAFTEADTLLAGIQQSFPDDPSVLLLRGEVLLTLGRAEDALPVLQHCAQVAPKRPRVNFQLATALEKSGDTKAALEAYAQEIEVNSDVQVRVLAHINRSLLLERMKDWSGAAAELDAVTSLAPERTQAYGDMASLQLQAGQLDQAASSLDRGLAAGFRSANHFHNLANRYYEKKAYDAAVTAFGKALQIDPTLAQAELGLGVALDKMGRPGEAVEHLQRYLDLRPGAPEATQVSQRIRAIRQH